MSTSDPWPHARPATQPDTWHNTWLVGNERYLTSALAWLRSRLAQLSRSEARSAADLAQAITVLNGPEDLQPPPALVLLSQRFGLSRFEQAVLLLCAAMELDTRIPSLCAQAQDDPNRPYPTLALALTLFDEPAWDLLSPERPLRYWRLIEINQTSAQPLTTSSMRANQRIVNYLKGLNELDEQLGSLLFSFDPHQLLAEGLPLPPSQLAIVREIVDHLRQAAPNQPLPVLQLLGADPASKQLIAWQTCTELGLHPYRLPVELLPAQASDLELLSRLWQRESLLLPLALYLDLEAVDNAPDQAGSLALLRRFLSRSNGIFFLDSRDVGLTLDRAVLSLDIPKPTPTEQRQLWQLALGEQAGQNPARLANQFRLNLAEIAKITQSAWKKTAQIETVQIETAQSGAAQSGTTYQATALDNLLWQGCLASTRPQLDTLAQRLDAKATWDDIVLPAEELDLLHQIADQVRQRSTVYDDWGFRRRMNRGLGVNALFAGESGTGKTMAAEVLANDLSLNLYRIDLSAVVSKYIGETEKNLRRLFDAAEDGGALLFFDEADALFGKRSEVKDSHDRYANIEVNYLLQRLETYSGLAILATNLKSALDNAFLRRLRFVIAFPFPSVSDRKRLWQKVFPEDAPTQALDLERLGRLNLAGGSIHTIAINAAFLAARAGTAVTMPHVLSAARTEFRKLERPINEADFRWQAPEDVA
ncbi:ATP-binding protein [Leptolyngbya sp. FACHB-261]|uniref:ATP-binding protein n=1 Tax=Leptolyngbya sp. FACHB-261 TaxID=2692806 RepID=UPI001688BAC5|nr:ATP-binding protein [Leptolyngbya sp. FACHB-261]MBD2102590.1 ATP-binding protein [Leptolyngbya sp. FACHB-261]